MMSRDDIRKIEDDLEKRNRSYQKKMFDESESTTRDGTNGIPKTKHGIIENTPCVKVRKTPSISSDNIVGVLDAGSKVLIVGTSGDFYRIDTNEGAGKFRGCYVMSKYIKEVPR